MNRLTQWMADNPVIRTWITLISLIGVVITVIATQRVEVVFKSGLVENAILESE